MSILDWVFIGALALAILCIILAIVFLGLHFLNKKQMKELKQRRVPKNKKKRILLKKKIQWYKKKAKTRLSLGITMFIVSFILAGSAAFFRYHQATNLGDKDSDGIVAGYYLLDEVTKQLNTIEKIDNVEKTRKNIRELAAKLSGFGIRYADPKLTVKGQQLLNRYYNRVKELGLNLNNQSIESLQSKEIFDDYMNDINKVQTVQKEVLTYFNVDESILKQKK